MMMPRRIAIACLAAGLVPAANIQDAHAQDNSAMADLVVEVQQLRDEVRRLRGQLEDQQREIENLKRRQRDQYLDLDERLQELSSGAQIRPRNAGAGNTGGAGDPDGPDESGSSAPADAAGDGNGGAVDASVPMDRPEVRDPVDAPAQVTTLPQPSADGPRDLGTPGEDEQAAYDRAFRALREQRYADAAEGFNSFLQQYPDSSYAPNAQYWLGEAYYVTRDFATALDIFQELQEKYPDSSKSGDALLKIGYSHYELEQWSEARAALEQVRSRYPGTTLARLAENRLRDLRMAGHY